MRVSRSEPDPNHSNLPWEARWGTVETMLCACWEAGVALASAAPEIAERARAGELVELPWKGGGNVPRRRRYAPLAYLAMWQGLSGQPLNIDTEQVYLHECTATKARVKFTADQARWVNAS